MILLSRLILSALALHQLQATEWQPLFNGQDLDGWKIIIDKQAVGKDPDGHVTVHDEMIHMYENTPAGDTVVPFGVIMTEESFSSFHFRVEYRWGEKKFRPRREKLRDAGLLYHCFGKDKIWPQSMECQIQEGDTGDLVFIESGGLTWMHPTPAHARAGLGQPGRLPEYGGILKTFPQQADAPSFHYIGRFPERDGKTGWNTVEAIVHANEYALHKVNGAVTSRVLDLRQPNGTPMTRGPIALQLEAAEVFYRNIEIRPLTGYLRPSTRHLALSRVGSLRSQTHTVTIRNPSTEPLALAPTFIGRDVSAFELETHDLSLLVPGQSRDFVVSFHPNDGPGRYAAGLQFGPEDTGCFVQLTALATPALEGANEPPLHDITQALGIRLDVGGSELSLNTEQNTIGASITASTFRTVAGAPFRLTPLARYSPPGETAFGVIDLATGQRRQLGHLTTTDRQTPDAHQSLLPPTIWNESFPSLPEKFSLYLAGHHYLSHTIPGKSQAEEKAPIKHTARIYPVSSFLGRRVQHAYLVAFEEAKNGDYQDAVFLIEGVQVE